MKSFLVLICAGSILLILAYLIKLSGEVGKYIRYRLKGGPKADFKNNLTPIVLGLAILLISGYFLDEVKAERRANLKEYETKEYKDYTVLDWKQKVDAEMLKWWNCAKNEDMVDELYLSVCRDPVGREGVFIKDKVLIGANLTDIEAQEVIDYWNNQWKKTEEKIHAQIELNRKINFPKKYQ